MFVRSRLLKTLLVTSLLVNALSLAACRKDRNQEAKSGAPQVDAIRRSLDALKPKLDALKQKFAELHKQIDPMPNLPGFDAVRAKFYNTDIGLGVMGPKLTWLSGRLDDAVKSGNREELAKVGKDIERTHEEFAQIDRIALEVLHQTLPFQRAAELQAKAAAAGSTPFVRVLGSGYEIKADADGVEQRLLELIEDPARKLDPKSWLDFDRVTFTNPGAKVDREHSDEQLRSVSEILKAYPAVKLALGGYSEAPTATKKLSSDRAQAVKQELVRLGVSPARLASAGNADPPSCSPDPRGCTGKSGVVVRVVSK